MASVAVLGLGPMGQAVARALLSAGHEVTVWNRTKTTAELMAEETAGLQVADSVGQAVTDASLVIACLRDEAALESVIADAPLAERTLINVTTGSPDQSRRRADWAAKRNTAYLTGAIMTPTTLMGTDQALVLYSGSADVHRDHQNTLAAFGGTGAFLGEDPGRASAFDAALLDLFWTATAGIVHSLALARAEAISASDLQPYAPAIFAMLPAMMSRFGDELAQGVYPGNVSTIGQADAGLKHLIEASQDRGLDTTGLRAAHTIIGQAIQEGHGRDGLGRLAAVLAHA